MSDKPQVSDLLTALYHRDEAAALGRTERVAQLLDAEPGTSGELAPDGFTALHLACFFGRADVATMLIERGAAVDAVAANSSRVQPLHSAAAARNEPIVASLLAAGADPDATQAGGWTALHAAAHHGDAAIAARLLGAGAARAPRSEDGKTPADLAREAGHAALVSLLA